MKQFWSLFWTQFLGAMNDNVLKNAMVVMITYQGLSVWGLDAPSIVALAGGIFILPFFLFSMIAGQLSDKYDKSVIVKATKIWELLITLTASAGFLSQNVEMLLGALFMMGMHSTFFGPVKYSALPELVASDKLVKANAYVELGTFVAILIGTVAGGVLIALPSGAYATIVAINLIAIAGVFTGFKVPPLPSHAKDLRLRFDPLSPLFELCKLLKKEVFSGILAISWFWFYGAAVLSVLPPYCKDFLRVNEHVVTAFLGMWTAGIGIGALLAEKLSNKRAELGLVPIGAFGLSLFLFDLSRFRAETVTMHSGLMGFQDFLATGYGWHMLADFLLLAICGGLFIVPLYTLMLERSEPSQRSRVIAGNNVINAVYIVAAALVVMGLHGVGASLPTTLMLIAGANIAVCGFLFLKTPEYFARLRERFKLGNS